MMQLKVEKEEFNQVPPMEILELSRCTTVVTYASIGKCHNSLHKKVQIEDSLKHWKLVIHNRFYIKELQASGKVIHEKH